jgi:dihydrofolate synthase/folylpolyglutamate synthase
MDDEEMAYQSALDWLFSRSRSGAARAPARMQALQAALQLPVPARVAHVAGTNGKGTVTHVIAAGMNAAGVRAGRFISPHVEDFRERIEAAGVPISRSEVTAAVQRYRQLPLQPPPAFFELALALALEHFHQKQVAFAAIEAGIGARNDATIVLGNTAITVLTSIALDHTDVLGSTVAGITRDKAAAIRPGVPVVTAEEGEALAVIREESARLGSPLLHPQLQPELFTLPASDWLPPAGSTRWLNLRLAAAALRQLGAGEEAVLAALQAPPLPGRGELFSVGGVRVLLDGAHDPAAAVALARSLPALSPGTPAGQQYTLIFAAQQRKQVLATLEPLAAGAHKVILTSVNGQDPLQGTPYERIADPQQALGAALQATPPRGLIVIAGSLYLAGVFRSLFMPRR